MPEQIDITNDPILNNLAQTDQKLQELNQEVVNIVNQYNQINSPQSSEVSFFNFNNPFFLLTLAGLFLLAFALWFLRYELKKNSGHKIKKNISPQLVNPEKIETSVSSIHKTEPAQEKKEDKSIKSSGRKIKVTKVK